MVWGARVSSLMMCAALAGCFERGPTGTVANQLTGMTYPAEVGQFKRGPVENYNGESDQSVGYAIKRKDAEIFATMYVYDYVGESRISALSDASQEQRDSACADEFRLDKEELVKKHPRAELLESGPTTLLQDGMSHSGFKAIYSFTATPNLQGMPNELVHSEVHVFCFARDRWTVKYRVTYPATLNARNEIDALMRDLTWTFKP